jgi:hypothetical protein
VIRWLALTAAAVVLALAAGYLTYNWLLFSEPVALSSTFNNHSGP